jgi:tRNA (guanine37-N1)-methyltransferase
MRFDLITLFPEACDAFLNVGVVGRARERQLLQAAFWNPRDYAYDNYRTIDDRPFGGGPGMLMLIEPLKAALRAARESDSRPAKLVYMSPQGQRFTQNLAQQWAERERVILLCGRYEGIDERFINHYVDEEVSLGDFVLSGGEPAAWAMIDAVTRLLPGVLNHADSAIQDSFTHGLLDCPHYTRPESADEGEIPAILKSGDHQKIAAWRYRESLRRMVAPSRPVGWFATKCQRSRRPGGSHRRRTE